MRAYCLALLVLTQRGSGHSGGLSKMQVEPEYVPRFVSKQGLTELVNLYHLARESAICCGANTRQQYLKP